MLDPAGEVARSLVDIPFRFRYIREAQRLMLIVPRTTSERRQYLPIGLLTASEIATEAIQVIYDLDIYAFRAFHCLIESEGIPVLGGL